MAKIILKDAFKRFTSDQDKTLSPKETVEHFKERLAHVDLDILKGTQRIDNGRLNIPVYFSVCGKDAFETIGSKKQMGKGGSPEQAEASAVMELAERFSLFSFKKKLENFIPENFIIGTYKNLKERAISFEHIALSVHDNSKELDAAREIFSRLPLKWTPAYNLSRDEEILLPFNWFYAINEFNGGCAGNCKEEALMQGISEVVERHVSALVSRNKLRVPLINLKSATDPLVLEMLQKYESAGIKIFASDFSLDTGIPTVGVLAYDPSTFPEMSEIVWTAGTTPNPEKALSRALTEVAQLGGDFNTGSNYVASGLPKFKSLEQADFIINSDKSININDLPDLSDNNIKTEIEKCVRALAKKNFDVIATDVRHPSLKIPAFYVTIPGTYFRERARGASVGMFSAKIIAESLPPQVAISELKRIDLILQKKYYVPFFMGYAAFSLNDPFTALSFFNEALERDPLDEDLPSIYSYMGNCLKDMGEYREAIDILKKAEKCDKERTDVYNQMGFCYFQLKEHEAAIDCFKKVIALNPGSAIDYANIASNYRDMGQKEKAIEYYKKALEIDPAIGFARDNLKRLTK